MPVAERLRTRQSCSPVPSHSSLPTSSVVTVRGARWAQVDFLVGPIGLDGFHH
jgi:hypothetical protein